MTREVLERSDRPGSVDPFADWYRRAFDEAPIGMLIVGPDGQLLRVNRALCGILGYDEDALLRMDVFSLTHPDDLDRSLGARRELISGEIDQIVLIKRFVRQDGAVVWTSVHSSIVRTETGEPQFFVAQIQDITARIEGELTLEQRGAILEAVAHAAHRLVASSEWEPEIEPVLARLGQAVGASHVILREIREENGDWVGIRIAEWISTKAAPAKVAETDRVDLAATGSSRVVETLRQREPVYLRHAETNDSTIGVPVLVGDELWGYLAIDDWAHDREWSAPVVDVLRAAADLLGGAIERQRATSALRESEEDLRHSQELMRELARRAVTVREEERSRISRRIHDELGQNLTALKMDLAYVDDSGKVRPDAAKVRAEAVDRMGQILDDTIGRVREIASELRPPVLDDVGLASAIEWAVAEFKKRAGIACSVHFEGDGERLDEGRSTALFRILQEALANVARHADASRVRVILRRAHDEVTLEIRDDGRGLTEGALEGPRSLGVLGMRERAASHGGELDIESHPGQGTTVRVRLPVRGSQP